MSTIQVNVVQTDGHVVPVVVNMDHDARPSNTIGHMLGWCHLSIDCEHPSCVASVKGTPQPSSEDIATWQQEHPTIMFTLGWAARVYGLPDGDTSGDAFRSGWLLCAAWMAATR